MKSIIYTMYINGSTGLSNLIMSLELGVVLSSLTDRSLILKGNTTPTANVVQYNNIVDNTYPSRVTDLIDLGVPWVDADKANLAAFAPHEICGQPAWKCVFYFPAHLSIECDDFRYFARRRTSFITIDDNLQQVPALSFSGGPGAQMLCFYSYFFYLDRAAQLQAHDALLRMKPKSEYAAFAKRIAEDLGSFNAVHIRRGDFKVTKNVSTRDRTPAEVIENLDPHFSRDDRLVVLTDEADDPYFDEIKASFRDHIFIDHHILENYDSEFQVLPAHDSIALAYISQLVAAESRDFVGTMTSTFTSLIQRMRGNRGMSEPFKFLWNEPPEPDGKVEGGRQQINNSVTLVNGVMVEQRDGPYSWNRCTQRLNPAWMREWPESFLDEKAMDERACDRKSANSGAVDIAPVQHADGGSCSISFLGDTVVGSSNRKEITDSIRALFEMMSAPSDAPPIGDVRIESLGERAELLVDGIATGKSGAGHGLLRSFYREIVCRFIDRHPELVWLHAGCAASSEGAVILPGSWGRGKSTLVLELYNRGWSFLSDDIAPLDPAKGSVIPFPGTPQVRSGSKKYLPREKLSAVPKSAVSLERPRVADGPRPVSTIIFPRFVSTATEELTPISPALAVGELLENCLSFAKNEDSTIHHLCAIVESLPVYSLRFDNAAKAADLLIGVHASANPASAKDMAG